MGKDRSDHYIGRVRISKISIGYDDLGQARSGKDG